MTAMVALGLQRVAAGKEASPRPSLLARLVRRMLLTWRWRRTRKVLVNVEVPVDREVEKRVEVPVETVVKEILYVPIFTDDPEALREFVDKQMAPELEAAVHAAMTPKRTTRGRKGASQA